MRSATFSTILIGVFPIRATSSIINEAKAPTHDCLQNATLQPNHHSIIGCEGVRATSYIPAAKPQEGHEDLKAIGIHLCATYVNVEVPASAAPHPLP